MRLEPLFDGELVYDEAAHTAVAPYGDDRWFGYTPAHGLIEGPRIRGTGRCHNLYSQLRSNPDLYRPHYRGAIETDDGALVLFDAAGFNRFEGLLGRVIMHMTFQTSTDRYAWLNETMAAAEANCYAVEEGLETERWTLHAFEIVHDLQNESRRVGSTTDRPTKFEGPG